LIFANMGTSITLDASMFAAYYGIDSITFSL